MRYFWKLVALCLFPLFAVGNAHAEEKNGLLEFLSDIDKILGATCSAVAPTTNDTVTGKKTLNKFSREEQIFYADKNAVSEIKDLKSKNIKLNDFNPSMYRRVQHITGKILAVSHLRDENWTLILVDDPEFNAWVFGGTALFINRGVVENNSDDEIAAVIGHELAHVALNHVFEKMSHQDVVGKTKSKSIDRDWYKVAFTHNDESEADKYGLLYATLAGYNPYAASRFWQRKHNQEGSMVFMRSHPMNSERAKLTRQAAQKWYKYYTPGEQNQNFANILESQKQKNISDNFVAGQGGGIAGCAETYAGIKRKHESAKREEIRQKQQHEAAVARKSFIAKVYQLISINEMQAVSPTELAVNINYLGNKPIAVDMFAVLAETNEDSKLSKGTLSPGKSRTPSYTIILEFDSAVFAGWQFGRKISSDYSDRYIKIIIEDARLLNS